MGGSGIASADPVPDEGADALAERAAELLAEIIRIPTVNPPGGEAPLAARLVEILSEAGIEARVIATPSKPPDPSRRLDDGGPGRAARAAAWARLPGTGRGRPVVLLSHIDVVPADPSEWTVPPFAGEIRDGFVIGRGALDAKGVAVTHLMTMLQLRDRDPPLDRDVIFLATPDEEAGGRDGAGYLARERRELLGDAEFLLTEGGSIRLGEAGAPPVWGVAVTEKSPCWLEIQTVGTPGHSAAPHPDAAVPRLVAALDRVRRMQTPIRVTPQVEEMFAALAPLAAEEDRDGYRNLAAALDRDPEFRRRFLGNRGRNALVRDTISITVLEGGPRTNVAPLEALAHLDVRLLPGKRCEDFSALLAEEIGDPAVRLRPLLSFPSRSSPTDTALYRTLERVAAEIDPGAAVVPRMITGFTDAHWFRELGIVAYGFVPRRLAAGDTRGVHGVDEKVSVDNLAWSVRTLVRILEEL